MTHSTSVYAIVKEYRREYYYTLPANLQDQYLDLCARIDRISQRNFRQYIAYGICAAIGLAAIITGFALAKTKSEQAGIFCLFPGFIFAGISVFCIVRKHENLKDTKAKLLNLKGEIAKKISDVHQNIQSWNGIQSINRNEIPHLSKIISFGRRSIIGNDAFVSPPLRPASSDLSLISIQV